MSLPVVIRVALASLFAVFASAQASAQTLSPRVLLKLSSSLSPVLVPVDLPSGRCLFLVDTGSSHSLADIGLLPSIDPSISVKPNVVPALNRPLRAEVGTFSVQFRNLAFYDLAQLRDAQDSPIMGVLGMDILKDFVLTFDIDNNQCVLSKTVESMAYRRSVELTKDAEGRFQFKAILGKRAVDLLLDTGSMAGVVVNPRDFDYLEFISGLVYSSEAYVSADGESSGVWMGQVGCVKVGSVETVPIFIHRGAANKSNTAGLAFLGRFNLCIDFAHDRMWYNESGLFDGRDSGDRSGLSIRGVTSENSQAISQVLFVRKGSDAELAGVRPGDMIFKVVTERETYSGASVYRALSLPRSSQFKLQIRREGKIVECVLRK